MRKYAIVTDFDGTITIKDIGNSLCLHFGRTSEDEIEEAYSVKADAREWMIYNFGGIKAGPQEFTDVLLSYAEIRDGFIPLLNYCNNNDVPVEIASGGLDIYIHPILKKYEVPSISVRSATGIFTDDGIKVEFPDYEGESLEGFKKARVLNFKKQGYTVIYCGDGVGDFDAAKESDFVYAVGHLANLCKKENIPFRDLDFNSVLEQIKGGK